ncbi:MAG: hypothetical protein HKM02_06370 [Pseudomonadales bacterium]|nr:hypothetical protein [Pseudomonadales bacterium]
MKSLWLLFTAGFIANLAQADMTELASKELNRSYIPGISIQHVNKKVPCAGKARGVSECDVAENLLKTENGQTSVGNNNMTSSMVSQQSAVSALNLSNGTPLNLDQHNNLIPTNSGLAVQNGQQVNIQLFTPMQITTTANSPNVDISTNHQGASIQFNLPQR